MRTKNLLLLIIALSPLLLKAQSKNNKDNKDNTFKNAAATTSCCCDTLPAGCIISGNSSYLSNLPVVAIDFRSKNIAFPTSFPGFKRGAPIQIKIVNYNPYLYKINIDNKDSTVVPSGDAKMLTWFLDPTNLSAIVGGLSALSVAAPGASLVVDKMRENLILQTLKGYDTLITKSNIEFYKTVKAKKQKVKDVIEKYRDSIRILNTKVVALNSAISDTLYQASKMLDFLSELSPDCSKFSNLDQTIAQLERTYADLRKKVAEEKVEVRTSSDLYLVDFASSEDVAAIELSYKIGDSLIRKYYSETGILLNKMDSALSYTELRKLTITLNGFKNLKTCYTSLPLFFSSDIKQFSIQMSPWKDSTRLPAYNSSFDIPWRQNFTLGASVGIYVSGLHNDGYSNSRGLNGTDTVYRLRQDNPGGGAEFGINAMAYAAWRINPAKSFFIGPAFGAGMSIESKPKPRIFLGPDFIWGEKNRIILSCGVNVGYTQRLSDSYDTNTLYRTAQSGYMKDYLTCSWYLSIHYSFLSK